MFDGVRQRIKQNNRIIRNSSDKLVMTKIDLPCTPNSIFRDLLQKEKMLQIFNTGNPLFLLVKTKLTCFQVRGICK